MTADALSSPSITNLDASPIVTNTSGVGASASSRLTDDFVTPTAAGLADTGSKYKIVRLPMYAKVKDLNLFADAALDTNGSPLLAVDVGAYYSDSTTDGTPTALQGTLISVNCFAAAVAYGASGNTNLNVASAWSALKRSQPLWTALGLTANAVTGAPPGGFIDVVVAVHTAAATASSHAISLRVSHVA
jgi:hypothetical protein